MRQLIVRFLNVAVIAAVLIGYNTVLDKRDKEDQIARLSAELETTQLQKENLQAAAAASNTADTAASEAAEAEGQYVDGTYDGEADGFGGTIAVEVTVEGGQITDLAITSADGEDSAYLSNAEAIIPKIIEAQSADVDTISGATFSSTGIRNAPSCRTVHTNGSHWDSDWYGLHSHWLVSSAIYPATSSPHSSRVPYTDRVHDGLPHENGPNYR